MEVINMPLHQYPFMSNVLTGKKLNRIIYNLKCLVFKDKIYNLPHIVIITTPIVLKMRRLNVTQYFRSVYFI